MKYQISRRQRETESNNNHKNTFMSSSNLSDLSEFSGGRIYNIHARITSTHHGEHVQQQKQHTGSLPCRHESSPYWWWYLQNSTQGSNGEREREREKQKVKVKGRKKKQGGKGATSDQTLILRKLLQNKINTGFDGRSNVHKQGTMVENRQDRHDTSD